MDKWGIKGMRFLMNNHSDYSALMQGMDPSVLGLEMSSGESVQMNQEFYAGILITFVALYPPSCIRFSMTHHRDQRYPNTGCPSATKSQMLRR
jgi:hypothetical protein